MNIINTFLVLSYSGEEGRKMKKKLFLEACELCSAGWIKINVPNVFLCSLVEGFQN